MTMKEESIEEAEGLWKFNKRSGLWDHQRTVTPETKEQWMKTFKDDEPNEHFVISKNKPNKKPSLKESAMNIEEESTIGRPTKKARSTSYGRQGGHGEHSAWQVHLNNGKKLKVWADSRRNAKDRLGTNNLIIGTRKIVPHPDHKLAPLAESGTITSAQIKKLKANYGVIPTMNPDSDNYKRLLGMIDKMAPDHLRQIAAADIKWLSGLAKNRINREKNTADTKKTFPNVKHVTKDGHPDWAKHGVKEESIDEARQSKHQKFAIGDKVFITKDLPVNMKHFTGGVKATVVGTYAQLVYGGAQGNIRYYKMYTLKIPGEGESSWYDEDQLTLVSSNKSVKEESIDEASEDFMQRLKKRINIRMNRSKLVRGRQNAEIAKEEVQNDDVIQVYIDRINKQKIKEGIRG